MTQIKYMPGHWGRHGFKRHPSLQNAHVGINVGELEVLCAGDKSVNLAELGYDKLLGRGRINSALAITVEHVSARAIKKIEAAGGSVAQEGSDQE
jgi:large subunit ribosomal protein L15